MKIIYFLPLLFWSYKLILWIDKSAKSSDDEFGKMVVYLGGCAMWLFVGIYLANLK